jgi:hypothetical protein
MKTITLNEKERDAIQSLLEARAENDDGFLTRKGTKFTSDECFELARKLDQDQKKQ